MADLQGFEREMDSALAAYRVHLEERVVPDLKSSFARVKSSFDAVHMLLNKMKLLRDDPYDYEERISEIEIPPDDDYLDSELDLVVAIRLTKYATVLDYVTNYVQFSVDSLDLMRLKRITQFVNYVNWRNVTETAAGSTTRGVAVLIGKVLEKQDPLSVNIVTDAKEQLNTLTKKVLESIKRIARYHREEYKLAFRREVIPAIGLGATPGPDKEDQVLRKCRGAMPRAMPGKPVIRELIVEILAENATDATGARARAAALEGVATPDDGKSKERAEIDIKPMLLEVVRACAAAGTALQRAGRKIGDNLVLIEDRRLSFGEVLRRVWDRMRKREQNTRTIRLEYVDPETTVRQSEEINLDEFITRTAKRARVYSSFIARMGAGWSKVESQSEESLLDFVSREITELEATARRIGSIDTYMKSEVEREARRRLLTMDDERETIRDAVSRGRKRLSAYIAKREEIEQLKKLGITPTP